ncbi:MAG: hypothetical protein ACYCTH_14860 [Cellulomonas sp.]
MISNQAQYHAGEGPCLDVSHTNAMKAIGRLVEAGTLAPVGGRRRSILWQSAAVLGALDAFAGRAGRRQPTPP